jgi:uncharacterized protein YdeI (YjbR/CyaY-like superfamily)
MRAEDCSFFESRAAFRAWLAENHDKSEGLHLGIYKQGTGRPTVKYAEAIEEALCFGWIDGVRHAIDELCFAQRFTPRRPGSNWSAINIKRVEVLIERGVMHEAGLKAFQASERAAPGSADRPQTLPDVHLTRLQSSPDAWAYFNSQPPWYQRTCATWVMDAKREDTRQRRLDTLIEDSAAGRWIKPLQQAASNRRQATRNPHS